jgi:hypothetical protein
VLNTSSFVPEALEIEALMAVERHHRL